MAKIETELEDNTSPAPEEPTAGWSFSSDDSAATQDYNPEPVATHQQAINWTASEYIDHEKDSSWFIKLGVAGVALGAVIFLVTRSIFSTIIVMVMVVMFGVFAARKPETLEYNLDNQGLKIGPKLYTYSHFKSFAIMDEGAVFSIMLLPMKRFMPSISIYYDQADEKQIVDVLSGHLAMEQRKHDLTDQLMRKIRF